MKNNLLGTTAIIAAGMIFASAAQGADKVSINVGGYFKAYLAAMQQADGAGQPGANRRGHRIAREGEIKFSGQATLDNGLTFGVVVELEAETCGDQIDESFIYIQGAFGRLVIGADDPASDSMYLGTPQPIAGVGISEPDILFSNLTNGVGAPASVTSISGDAEKITYFTPRMSGFQLGISYTPENCEERTAGSNCTGTYGGGQGNATANQQSEIIELGSNYIRRVGNVDLGVYAGYGTAELEIATAGAEDREQWGLGVELGYRDFTFGADYREDNQGTSAANTDRTDYSMGVTYVMGSWTLAAAYAHGEVEAGVGLGEDETNGYQVGVAFDLGPGITLTGGMTYWDVEDNLNDAASENTSTEFIIGTLLSF